MKNYFQHKTALIESENIGENSRIWAFTHILKNAQIGKNANICDHCFIENNVTIGDNTTIKCGVYIWDGTIIGNNVFIGPNVTFTNDKYPRSNNFKYKQEKIFLSDNCSIGANSTILAGVSIGKGAMVGAGSVVTKNVSDYTLVYGNQATAKGFVCLCGNKMCFKNKLYKCACNRIYEIINTKVKLTNEK